MYEAKASKDRGVVVELYNGSADNIYTKLLVASEQPRQVLALQIVSSSSAVTRLRPFCSGIGKSVKHIGAFRREGMVWKLVILFSERSQGLLSFPYRSNQITFEWCFDLRGFSLAF